MIYIGIHLYGHLFVKVLRNGFESKFFSCNSNSKAKDFSISRASSKESAKNIVRNDLRTLGWDYSRGVLVSNLDVQNAVRYESINKFLEAVRKLKKVPEWKLERLYGVYTKTINLFKFNNNISEVDNG